MTSSTAVGPADEEPAGQAQPRLGLDVFWSSAGQGLAAVGSLVTLALAERLLDVASLGRYFVAAALVVPAAAIARVGMDRLATREVTRALGLDAPAEAAARVTRFAVLSACVIALVAAAAGTAVVGGGRATALVAAGVTVWVVGETLRPVGISVRRAVNDVAASALFGEGLRVLISITALATLLVLGGDVRVGHVVLAAAGASLVAGIATHLPYLRDAVRTRLGRDLTVAYTTAGSRIAVTALAGWSLARADVVVVGWAIGDSAAGRYGLAARLIALLILPITAMQGVLGPRIVALLQAGRPESLERLLRQSASALGAFVLFGLVLAATIGEAAVALVFGDEYRQIIPLVLVLGGGVLVNATTGSCGTILTMSGDEDTLLRIVVVSALATLALVATAATTTRDPMWVAAAFAVGFASQNLWAAATVWRLHRLRTWATLRPFRR